ncbi:MAG: ABC transporter permease [Rhizobiales bacterium 65-9]|nr:ABC transporter permease [Hyphomicrobiales bacterium]OJY36482.1 MAG: ABC transporter permease [Rhizobiales bacterium 65-9]
MTDAAVETPIASPPVRPKPLWRRALESDLLYSFRRQKLVMAAAAATALLTLLAVFAPLIAPHTPFDLSTISIIDANLPPRWIEGGDPQFLLGTDNQGRDIFSTIIYGLRISIGVGVLSVVVAMTIGVTLGLAAGYFGGRVDSIIMRVADIQLTFPAILTALLVDGVLGVVLNTHKSGAGKVWILIVAIGLSYWVQYARTVRGSTLVERNKDYVQAARLIGINSFAIMFRHVLPNVMGPVMVIATINLALAIITEATLSFLGVGMPPTEPSLGTLINIGYNFLFSGEWWIVAFPGFTLAILVLAVNLLGDWLRDALNPRLR